jgi:hypothetical protein
MINIDLNAGGLIDALAWGGIAAAVVFATVEPANAGRTVGRIVIYAMIGGAFGGNFLWSRLFKKPAHAPRPSIAETDEYCPSGGSGDRS